MTNDGSPRVKLIVFDFDGTLVDSRALILECHRAVFTEFGLPVPAPQGSLALIGRSLELVLAHLAGPGAPVPDMVKAYGRIQSRLRAEPGFAERPFDGVAGLLDELSHLPNTVLGIATGHTLAAVAPALDALGWRDFFRTIPMPREYRPTPESKRYNETFRPPFRRLETIRRSGIPRTAES